MNVSVLWVKAVSERLWRKSWVRVAKPRYWARVRMREVHAVGKAVSCTRERRMSRLHDEDVIRARNAGMCW